MTPGSKARILRVLEAALRGVDSLCEDLDESIIDLMPDGPKVNADEENWKEYQELCLFCGRLKDARVALHRAKGAVP